MKKTRKTAMYKFRGLCATVGVDYRAALGDQNVAYRVPGVWRKVLNAARAEAETVIVTRHAALVEHLRGIGLAEDDTPVLSHATPDDVRGRHVIGVLPLRLAVLAARVTEIPLDVPPEWRGRELTLDEIRQVAGEPVTYTVEHVEWSEDQQ